MKRASLLGDEKMMSYGVTLGLPNPPAPFPAREGAGG